MELAKITLRGQITIPAEIRKKLCVKDGDKVVFIRAEGFNTPPFRAKKRY